jgi:hypothetical protein
MRLWLYPGNVSNNLIISAHGQAMRGPMFPSPCELVFYSLHTVEATGTSFSMAAESVGGDNASVKERVAFGADSHNYMLTKFQGRHKGNLKQGTIETYGGLQNWQSITSKWNRNVANMPKPNKHPVYDDYDILTIRNRWSGQGIDFWSAIVAARRYRPYLRVHCSFCRSN